MTERYIYAIGDGDNVRINIEKNLLNGELQKVKKYSQSLTESMDKIKIFIEDIETSHLIFCGGDDICFQMNKESFDINYIRKIMTIFSTNTGSSISFGIGPSIEAAYINLRRAKAQGGNAYIKN